MREVDPKILHQLKNLADLLPLQLKKLADNLSAEPLVKNHIIFDQGDNANRCYLLLSGVAKLSYVGDHERATIVGLLPAGRFFGLDSLVPKSRYAFRCEAFEDGIIGSVSPKTLIEIFSLGSHEGFLRAYVAILQPSRASYIRCIAGIGGAVRRRLAMELLNLADHFGAPDPRGISITLNLSHELLASLVGASRQQVTEYLNQFDHDRIIFRDGRRIILNPKSFKRS